MLVDREPHERNDALPAPDELEKTEMEVLKETPDLEEDDTPTKRIEHLTADEDGTALRTIDLSYLQNSEAQKQIGRSLGELSEQLPGARNSLQQLEELFGPYGSGDIDQALALAYQISSFSDFYDRDMVQIQAASSEVARSIDIGIVHSQGAADYSEANRQKLLAQEPEDWDALEKADSTANDEAETTSLQNVTVMENDVKEIGDSLNTLKSTLIVDQLIANYPGYGNAYREAVSTLQNYVTMFGNGTSADMVRSAIEDMNTQLLQTAHYIDTIRDGHLHDVTQITTVQDSIRVMLSADYYQQ